MFVQRHLGFLNRRRRSSGADTIRKRNGIMAGAGLWGGREGGLQTSDWPFFSSPLQRANGHKGEPCRFESRQKEASKGLKKEKKVNRKDGKGRVEKEPMTVSSLYILYTPQC